jgi:hypothetical protein
MQELHNTYLVFWIDKLSVMSRTVNLLFYFDFIVYKGTTCWPPYVFSKMVRVVARFLFLEQVSITQFMASSRNYSMNLTRFHLSYMF